jgi:hypothetical protein
VARLARAGSANTFAPEKPEIPQRDSSVVSFRSAGRAVAAIAVALVGARLHLQQGLTVGTVVAFALIPFWLPSLKRYWGARWFMLLGAIVVGAGIWLTVMSTTDHSISRLDLLSNEFLVGGAVASVGVLLWARERMRDSSVALWYGLGLAVGILPADPQFATNPWKFGFAIPAIVLLLALARRIGRRWAELGGIAILAGIDAVSDSRSQFAMLLLTGVLLAWQMRPPNLGRRASAFGIVLVMGALAVVVYFFGQAIILDGFLGQAAQARSTAQIDSSGSLIVGGRPELAATLALMQHRPLGYGAGAVPNLNDILVAKSGMAAINYAPNNGYVENYMFGGHFEVHSVIGDLWARFGIAGVLLAVTILFLTLRGMSLRLVSRSASAIVLFLGVNFLWNIAFGPLLSSIPTIILLVGLVVIRRPQDLDSSPVPGPRRIRPDARSAIPRVRRPSR